MQTPPALISQRKFKQAWGDQIAANLDLNKIGYPIINLRDGIGWVCDGQHRIYGLRQNDFGDYEIECEVYENLTDEEMAALFLGRDDRKAVSPFEKFFIGCTAGYERENAIRRVVEINGVKIARTVSDNCVACVSSLVKIYEASADKDVTVGWVIRVAKRAFEGDPKAFDGAFLEALGAIHIRYGSRATENILIEALNRVPQGVRTVLRLAEAWRVKNGLLKVMSIAHIVVEIYNRNVVGKGRLPPWFKDAA